MKIILLSLFLVGCNSIPVIPQFPPPPDDTLCEQLIIHPVDKREQRDVATTIVQNYTIAKICAAKVNMWNDWYINQKLNYEAIRAKR